MRGGVQGGLGGGFLKVQKIDFVKVRAGGACKSPVHRFELQSISWFSANACAHTYTGESLQVFDLT